MEKGRRSEMTVEKLLTEVQVQKTSHFVLAALRRNGEERINARV